jgi:hypothetical protein
MLSASIVAAGKPLPQEKYQPAWKARNPMCDDTPLLLMMGRALDRRQHCLTMKSPVA